MASIEFITNKVKTSGISNVTLGTAEIMSIVKLLMYDNKIEEVSMLKNQVGLIFMAMIGVNIYIY